MKPSTLFGAIALFACAVVAQADPAEQACVIERPCKDATFTAPANEGAVLTAYRHDDIVFGTLPEAIVIGCPGCHASRDAGVTITAEGVAPLTASSGGMPG